MAQFLAYLQGQNKRRRAKKEGYAGLSRLEEGFNEAKGYWKPQYDFGQERLNAFKDWREGDGDMTSDPSYQFRLQQGNESLQNSAIAKGGLLSGNAMKAIQGFGQDMASQEYQNEFQRRMLELGYGSEATNAMAGLASQQGQAAGTMRAGIAQQNFTNLMEQWRMSAEVGQKANDVAQSWTPGGGGVPKSGGK